MSSRDRLEMLIIGVLGFLARWIIRRLKLANPQKERAAQLKLVRLDGFMVEVPRGLSAEDEAAHIEAIRQRIADEPALTERRDRAIAAKAKFDQRRYDQRVAAAYELVAKHEAAKLDGGENPNG